jgi:hypothetical protein
MWFGTAESIYKAQGQNKDLPPNEPLKRAEEDRIKKHGHPAKTDVLVRMQVEQTDEGGAG